MGNSRSRANAGSSGSVDSGALKRELELLKKKVESQESELTKLRQAVMKSLDVEYLSNLFITREEYPLFKDLSGKLALLESRIASAESSMKKQLDIIESETVEHRKIIDRLRRKHAVSRVLPVAAVIRMLTTLTRAGGRK